jgi:hypothetical protein
LISSRISLTSFSKLDSSWIFRSSLSFSLRFFW